MVEEEAKEGTTESPDPLTDGDREYFNLAIEAGREITGHIRAGLALVAALLVTAPRPLHLTAVNDLAGIACFVRAFRQIRSATLLAHFGYLTEVPTVLRGAYESGALGRFLAHEPTKAEKWLEKGGWIPEKKDGWIPDREVREWFGDPDAAYAAIYSLLSKGAHPTAHSCFPLLELSPDGRTYTPRLHVPFEEKSFEDGLLQILGVVLWCCFAVKNAAPSEQVLPAEWRKALRDFADSAAAVIGKHTGHTPDFSHLERDWEIEYEKWERFIEEVAKADELPALLQQDPGSWHNIRGKLGDEGPPGGSPELGPDSQDG